ncbi:hypothetical protein PABG_04989 [Paracoccidioides brasiliensis Pb03]|nr:hypothetical protein PABG_04989 [Paracoccidioides brasiliensis Pb03]
MTESKMRLEDWLDDLCVRFIVNLPREELESVERICFQVEEAQWFYEDFIRPLDPNLPSLSLRAFALRIFQHCPLMSQWSHYHHSTAFSEFLAYKTRVPVRGAILLNQDMDEVVLVKGWKKNANWSFPRGKINKDEKDLDCAIREVYEETGFDIRAAGLVKDEKKIKYIEIPMREQNMRLYVLRGVPMDTVFEPRTRKEISKIQWYKLSELPTLKKSKLIETDGHNLSNKFYMVAPFLVPLKKWIAQQKRADLAAAQNLNSSAEAIATDGLLVEEDGLSANEALPKECANEAQLPSDLPEVSMAQDPSTHLKRLLNISTGSSLPDAPTLPQPQLINPDLPKGSALLALLRRSTDTGMESTSGKIVVPTSQPAYFPKDIMQQQGQHRPMASQPNYSQPPAPPHHTVAPIPPEPGEPKNQILSKSMSSSETPGQVPLTPFSYPFGHPLHRHQQPPHVSVRQFPYLSFPTGVGNRYPGNQRSTLPEPPRPPFEMSVSSAPSQVPYFNTSLPQRQTPAPYQRTGDPEFVQNLFPNLHAPSIPPASKLPPPKLTRHSLALLNVFKNDSVKKTDVSKPELESQSSAPSKVQSQHQNSLLELLKKPQAAALSAHGRAELAARPTPSLGIAKAPAPEVPAQSQQKTQEERRKSPNNSARISATVSGPLNLPKLEAIAKSVSKKSVTQSLRPTTKQEVTPTKGNFVILPRPPTVKKEATVQQLTKPPPSAAKRNVQLSEIRKPFQPKILRRPVKDDLAASLPTETVPVSAFTLSEKQAVPENRHGEPVAVNYDRRPSQTASQKEALLSLFGKPPHSPAAVPPTEPVQAPSPGSKIPPQSAIISPVDSTFSQVGTSGGAPTPVSRVRSISPVVGTETSKAGPTSPVNKAFLLGYLDGVAKGTH